MDKIKLYILFLFWPWIATFLWSIYKFKTSGLSVLEKKERGKWGSGLTKKLVNVLCHWIPIK
jgi:hypothetical protein